MQETVCSTEAILGVWGKNAPLPAGAGFERLREPTAATSNGQDVDSRDASPHSCTLCIAAPPHAFKAGGSTAAALCLNSFHSILMLISIHTYHCSASTSS